MPNGKRLLKGLKHGATVHGQDTTVYKRQLGLMETYSFPCVCMSQYVRTIYVSSTQWHACGLCCVLRKCVGILYNPYG